MIEIIKSIINLMNQFINSIFQLEIDLAPNMYISLGDLVIGFLVVVLSIYLILRGFGVISKGDDD